MSDDSPFPPSKRGTNPRSLANLRPSKPGEPSRNPEGHNGRRRSELIAAVPDAVSSIPREGWGWQNLCDGLGQNLRKAGFTHHWHEPAVQHRGTAIGSLQDPGND